jgi:hypothetical protein
MIKAVLNCLISLSWPAKVAAIVVLLCVYLYICMLIFDKHAIYYHKDEMGGYLPFDKGYFVYSLVHTFAWDSCHGLFIQKKMF